MSEKPKKLEINLKETLNLSDRSNIGLTREFIRKNKIAFSIILIISIAFPIIGFFIGQAEGLILGLIGSAISLKVGPHAVEKVKESHTFHQD